MPTRKMVVDKTDIDEWHRERRKEQTGVCCNCGDPTEKHNDKYFKWSNAHILPKNDFPSVATNEYNCMELCVKCHTLYDRNWMTAETLPCFEIARQRYKLFKGAIAQDERRRIPSSIE